MLIAIRIILIIPWIIFSTLTGTIVSMFRPFNPDNIYFTCGLIGLGRHILGIKIIIRNQSLLDTMRPCVFVSNHQHNIDIFPGACSIPRRTVSIGKRSIIFIPFFGMFYWLSGNILIDRKNKRSAHVTMDKAASIIKEKNISVWIMPEGTRSRGRGLLPFKKGPFVTAIKAQVPVVPIIFSNFVGKIKLNRWHAGTIIVEVQPPISTENLTMSDVNDLKDKAYQSIKSALSRVDHEIQVNRL